MTKRFFAALFVLGLITAACIGPETAPEGTSTVATTTAPATTSAPTTSTTDAGSDLLRITDCTDRTAEFALFCQAYDILVTAYVDPLDDAALAAGALQGISEYDHETGSPAGGVVACAAPSDAFLLFCDAYADTQMTGADDDTLIEAAIRGLMDFGIDDPNSTYLPPDVLAAFREENSGQIEGIGALVRGVSTEGENEICNEISETCVMEIVTPLDGSPAQAAGILPGDVMVSVNGEPIIGKLVDEVVFLVRGPAGTDVTLGIDRVGEMIEITITRAPIVIPVVESEMLTDDIGYLSLAQFTATAGELVDESLQDLIDQGATTIIFDLQNNPGGLLDAAIDVASEFLDSGTVLSTQSPGETIDYDVLSGGVATDPAITVYVLINRGSASASEVVAGALQDAGRATLVGENSFGKNTVQRQFGLSNGGALKITIARWVTPDGNDYGKNGVTPDVIVELPDQFDPDFLVTYTLDLIRNAG
ncbi:MAG: S41 family peptidase [Acidimicrobiia bacterium]|nr:S41 family peptidase [Acidimicrobiia bacterium]